MKIVVCSNDQGKRNSVIDFELPAVGIDCKEYIPEEGAEDDSKMLMRWARNFDIPKCWNRIS